MAPASPRSPLRPLAAARLADAALRARDKFAREGARGVLRALARRVAPSRFPPAAEPPPSTRPYDSVQLLKDVPVTVLSRRYRAARARTPFAVVITVKNEAARLSTFLSDLDAQTLQPEELLVVDGGSTDDTLEQLRRWVARRAGVTRLLEAGPVNIARGRNLGVARTRSPVLLFVDAGCRLERDLFANLQGPFDAEDAVDLVAGLYRPAAPSPHAAPFVPNWRTLDFRTFLPSARCLAVRRSVFDQAGGFPEYLTLTGEDTLFGVRARRASRRWVVNLRARVTWEAPRTSAQAERLLRAYAVGDGESGTGDFAFAPGETAPEGHPRAHQLAGYREGLARRASIEVERRGVRSVVVLFSGVAFTDIGGGQRATQLALELVRRGHKVVFVNKYPRYGDQVRKVFFDIDYSLLELYFHDDFDPEAFAARYAPLDVAVTVVTEFPHPAFADQLERLQRALPRARYVFDYIDLWESSLGTGWFDAAVERQLIARADLLVASAATLQQALEAKAGRRAHLLANAVNGHLFRADLRHERPPDVPAGRPYCLYVGSLYGDWFDWGAMEAACAALPGVDFVFVGDHKGVQPAEQLARTRPNAHFLGPRPQRDLPPYLQHAAACLIPFRTDNEITRYVNPLKVYEYLAMHRPVVATRMEDLVGMPGVTLAESSEAFGGAVAAAMAQPFDTTAVDAFVRRNDWTARVAALEGLLALPHVTPALR